MREKTQVREYISVGFFTEI